MVSGVAAFALAVLPQLQFAHNGVLLHVALETAASLVALLAGFLVFGRLRRLGNVNDLLLACALAVFVLLNLCFLILPALARSRPNDLIVWVLLIGRSLGAVLFALAAFASHRRLGRHDLALAASVAGGCAIVLLAVAFTESPKTWCILLRGRRCLIRRRGLPLAYTRRWSRSSS